jgi:glycosyltransferase involved in cell wall biosynthesis
VLRCPGMSRPADPFSTPSPRRQAPLRVLYVVPYFRPSPTGGGIRVMAEDLAGAMVDLGCQVTVLTTDVGDARGRAGSPGRPIHDPPGVRVLRLRNLSNALAYRDVTLPFWIPRGGAGPALPGATARALGDFDVIHLYGHRHLLAPLALTLARRHGRPLFLSTQGTAPRLEGRFLLKRFYDSLVGDRVLRSADCLIGASKIETRDFDAAGIPRERVIVIPNAIPTRAFENSAPPGRFRAWTGVGSRPLILFLASITERKGIHHLARAMGRVTPREAMLAAAGLDVGFGRVVRRAAREAGATNRIVFTGHLSDERRLEAYTDADLFVLPSEREVFGLSAFEALLCGVPVIATTGTGCGEILARTGGGWIVPQRDPGRLAEAISHALAHPEEGRERAARGAAMVRAEMDIGTHARHALEAYRKRAASSAGGAPGEAGGAAP